MIGNNTIALITALRDGNTVEAGKLNQQWYANADKKLTTEEVSMRLAANYPAGIQAFDNVEREHWQWQTTLLREL